MSRSNDTITVGKSHSINLLKCLILSFIFWFNLSQINAQTFFTNPIHYLSFNSWHEGNSTAQSVDMDEDGDLDIIFSSYDYNAVTTTTEYFVHIRVNDGAGGFGAIAGLEALGAEGGVRVSLSNRPSNFDIGDLNGDNLPDIVIVSGGTNEPFLVAQNTSSGGVMSFDTGTTYGSGRYTSVSIDDINDDGNKDLIITRKDSNEIELFYGDGTGANWSSSQSVSGRGYDAHVISDFNGDDILDIMAIQDTNSRLFYFKGDSLLDGSQAGTFQGEIEIGTFDTRISRLFAGDFNGDGLPDIVATDEADGKLGTFINDGDGTSFTESVHTGFTFDLGLAVNDITNDGQLDFIVSDGSKEIDLFEGNGDGTFNRTKHSYLFGSGGSFIARHATTGDYNNDGIIDMAAIDFGPHVFLNNTKADLRIDQAGTDINSGGIYDFGYLSIGTSSGAATFTIDNNGALDAVLSDIPKIQISGPQAARFSIDDSGTTGTITPGSNTSFTITFTPSLSDEGINTAVLSIPSNDPLSPYTINLLGTTQLTPDNVTISSSTICDGESTTLTESNGIIGAGEQWVWYSGTCGGTQEGIGESIVVSPSVTTDYFVRAETTGGTPLTDCVSGQVVVSGEVVSVATSFAQISTALGEDQVLSVTATGTSPAYQWLKNGMILTDGGRVSGSQTNMLSITALEQTDEDTYTCEVTNFCSTESIDVELIVQGLPPGDICSTVLDFDGSNDYVSFGDVLNLTNAITLEAWINTDALGQRQGIVGKPYTSSASPPYYQYHTEVRSDGKIYFALSIGGTLRTVESTKKILANGWYHIAATYDGTVMKLYVDGVEWGSTTISGTLSTYSTSLRVGAPANFVFNGKVDEVRVWDIARSQAEVVSNMTNTLTGSEINLAGYWGFDEGVGSSVVIDKSNVGNDGTLTNMNAATDWLLIDGTVDDDNSSISASACPDYLSPSGNFTWNATGVYSDTLQTVLGCDSIITVSLTIEPQDQIITFGALPDMTYGDMDVILPETTDFGRTILYVSSDPGVATISGNTLSTAGVGTVTITASQAGDACANPASNVVQNLTINKATLTATADNKGRSYGETDPVFTFSYSGFANGENESSIDTPPTATTIADAVSGPGSYDIIGSGGLDDNYSFLITNGTLTVFKAILGAETIDRTQVYGGVGSPEGYTFGALGADFVNGEDESVLDNLPIQTTSVDANSPVGSYTISSTYDANVDNNYDIAVIGTGTYTVTPAQLIVEADHLAKIVGMANPPLTISYSGFVNGENESVLSSSPTISTTADVSSPIGTYPITIVGAAGDNYTTTHVDGTLTVTNNTPLIVTADSQTKKYGETDPALTYQLTSGTLMPGDMITGAPSRTLGEDVGTYIINQGTLTAGSNYSIVFISADLTITPEEVTITANNTIKKTGSINPVFTLSYDGFVNGEDESVLTILPTVSTTAVTGSPVGTYPITASGAMANNYNFTYVDGSLDIFEDVPNTLCGNVLNFDGSDDHVDLGDVIEPTNITLEAWVNASNVNGRNGILGKPFTSNAPPYYQYHLSVRDGGDVYFALSANGGLRSVRANNVITTNTWYHVAASYNGSTLKIYVDGVEAASANTTGNISNYSTSLTIGSSAGFEFNGQIDEVRIWDVGRSQTEIADNKDIKLQGNEMNLVGYWDFDEGSGSDVLFDKSANGNDGALTNMDPLLDWTLPDGTIGGNSSGSITINQCGGYTSPSGNETWTTTGIYQDIIPNQHGCDSLIIVDLTIQQLSQVIDFQPLANKTYGDADFLLNATADSGLPVTYTSSDPSVATISGSTVSITGAGMITITASQIGGSCYDPAIDVPQNLTIDPVPITITADPGQSKTYGDVDPTFTYSVTAGSLEPGDLISGSLVRIIGEDFGPYAINQGTIAAGSNYVLTFVSDNFLIEKRALTIIADAASKIYGQTDPVFTYELSQSLESGDVLAGALERETGTDVGGYAITIGTLDNDNYDISFVSDNLTITQRPIEITADAAAKQLGTSDPSLSYQITNGSLASGDSFSGDLTRELGESIGTYAIQQGTVDAGTNYTLSFVPNNFEITPIAITVTVDNFQAKTYGDTDPTLTYSVTSGSLEPGDSFTGTLERVAGEDAINYAINQGTLNAGSNYDITFVPGVFGIFQRPINVTADIGQSKVYGEDDPVFTFTPDPGGLVAGDVITGSVVRVAGENVGTYAINQGTLDISPNYNFVFWSNNFTITPKSLIVTPDVGQGKTYGDADPTLTYSVVPGSLETGDMINGVLNRAIGEDTGNYMIGQGSLSAGTNYSITIQNEDFVITPALLSATADDQSRLYNEANPSFTITYNGFVNGEDVSSITEPTTSTTATMSSNVGTYPITIGGGSALNYTITNNDGTLTINEVSQTIIFTNIPNKVQGDQNFDLPEIASSGLSISYTSSNPSVATVSGNTVTVLAAGTTTITAAQPGSTNYTAATPVDQDLTVEALYIWNGSAWNNGTAPMATDNAKITGNYNFSTNGIFEANDLTIESGVTLIVDVNHTLQTNGALNNDGTLYVASGGSLITMGTVSGTDYQIDRITTFDESTGRYSIMGSPVQNASFTTLGANALVYGYVESILYNSSGNQGLDRFKTPTELLQTTMMPSTGYFSAFTGDVDGEVSFTGTPNTGTINVPLPYTDHGIPAETAYQGFNLISNPYPSAINYNTLIAENNAADITGSIYLWDDNNSNTARGSNADYVIVNSLGNTDSNNGLTKWDGYIRSGQGFFVQTNSPTILTFNNNMRISGNNSDDGFYRTTKTSSSIKLLLSNKDHQKATVVGFTEDATIGLDKNYDAVSLSQSATQLYSVQPESQEKLGIQGLPANYQEKIQLGFKAGAGTHTISIVNIKELLDVDVVLLKDHLTNRTVNLKDESYNFTTTGTVNEERFTLQVAPSVVSSIDQLNEKVFYSYSTENQLHVVFETVGFEQVDIKLIDLTGKTIHEESRAIRSNKWQLDTSEIPEQIYILMIQTDYGVWKRRVITK